MTEEQFARIEAKTRQLGQKLGAHCPPGWGFALFIFEFGPQGMMHYVSNADRDDITTMLMEFIARSQEKGFWGQNVDC